MPAGFEDRIVHGSLTTASFVLLGSGADGMGAPRAGQYRGVVPQLRKRREITTVFNGLSDGGTFIAPLADMFWGGKFGVFTDRFGMNEFSTTKKAGAIAPRRRESDATHQDVTKSPQD